MRNASAWGLYHPLVPVAYLLAVLVFAMALRQPALVGMSLLAAIAYHFALAGPRSTLCMLAWQLPMLLIIAFANPLFSASGSTELLHIGPRVFYAESLLYGFTTGGMLVAVMVWFSCGNRILDSDQVLLLGARVMPLVSLMVSMTLKLVPQFVRRGHQVLDAQKACSAASVSAVKARDAEEKTSRWERFLDRDGSRSAVGGAARQASVLMGWGMEDSLETADAMRARAWGCGLKRSCYETRRFRAADAFLLAAVLLLAAASIACAVQLMGAFRFYPAVRGWGAWWLYVPYALLLLLPFLLELREWLRWR